MERLNRGDITIRQLAEYTGKSMRTVTRYTSQPREKYLTQAAERHHKIKTLRKEQKTYREIAQELGISIGTVHYALKK